MKPVGSAAAARNPSKLSSMATTSVAAQPAAVTSSAVPPRRELPAKEAAAFKMALKAYETREYKRGLKTCDGILKKVPEHGGAFCPWLFSMRLRRARRRGVGVSQANTLLAPETAHSSPQPPRLDAQRTHI